jgi:hypothetical protein
MPCNVALARRDYGYVVPTLLSKDFGNQTPATVEVEQPVVDLLSLNFRYVLAGCSLALHRKG